MLRWPTLAFIYTFQIAALCAHNQRDSSMRRRYTVVLRAPRSTQILIECLSVWIELSRADIASFFRTITSQRVLPFSAHLAVQ